jgi:hypothetical protein
VGADVGIGDAAAQQRMRTGHLIPDVEPGHRKAQVVIEFAEADEAGDDLDEVGRPRVGVDQNRLRAAHFQDVRVNCVPFVVIGVQQRVGGIAAHDSREFPAEIEGVLHTHVDALPADRQVDAGGVAGQEHLPRPGSSRPDALRR